MNREISQVRIAGRQNAMIKMKAGVISELFQLLMQHMSADEAGGLPCMGRVDQAARIQAGIGIG